MSVKERLLDAGYEDAPHFINPDYEDALIGTTDDGRAVFNYDKMIECLMDEENWSYDEALDWVEYNVIRSVPYMGKRAPIIVHPID